MVVWLSVAGDFSCEQADKGEKAPCGCSGNGGLEILCEAPASASQAKVFSTTQRRGSSSNPLRRRSACAIPALNTSMMNDVTYEVPDCIRHDVARACLDLLAGIKPPRLD